MSMRFIEWSRFFKSADSLREKILRGLSFEHDDLEFYLVPVSQIDSDSTDLVSLIMDWRNQNQDAFPTRFTVTHSGTSKWLLNSVIQNDHKILFMILSPFMKTIGHLGLLYVEASDSIEVDNIVRGSEEHPGVMAKALLAVEAWVEEELSRNEITLKVLSSNSHAIAFYSGLEYREVGRVPMKWETTTEGQRLIPNSNPDEFMILMSKSLLTNPSLDQVLTAGPSISSREISYTNQAVRYGWNQRHSSFLTDFERKFAEYIGVEYAIATSSCTGALHLALNALAVGTGDEVIVPDITWVATASAVMYTGAKPVFVDVNPLDWTIDVEDFKRKITPRTKAVIPVHLYGFPSKMLEISKIAKEFGLSIVEDAAPAIGSTIGTDKVGTFGSFGCFSFQGAKLLVTGEGGMLVTNDQGLYERARKDQDHGRKPNTFWIESLGHKYKMNNITAALGVAQLERVENQIERKRRIFSWYFENLSDLSCIQFQQPWQGSSSIYWMTSILLNTHAPVSRTDLMGILADEGIDTRPVFPSISQYPIWGYQPETQPSSSYIAERGINLPSGVLINRATVERVCAVIRRSLGG